MQNAESTIYDFIKGNDLLFANYQRLVEYLKQIFPTVKIKIHNCAIKCIANDLNCEVRISLQKDKVRITYFFNDKAKCSTDLSFDFAEIKTKTNYFLGLVKQKTTDEIEVSQDIILKQLEEIVGLKSEIFCDLKLDILYYFGLKSVEILKTHGIYTIGDLLVATPAQIVNIDNIGKSRYKKIEIALKEFKDFLLKYRQGCIE